VTFHRHPLLRLFLLVVLLLNGSASGSAWAAVQPAGASAQAAAAHAHCFDVPRDEAPASRQPCCSADACHCLSSNLSASPAVLPVRVALLLRTALAARDQDGLPTPTLTRHFRPPISSLPRLNDAASRLA
jgi:hypothetical protein